MKDETQRRLPCMLASVRWIRTVNSNWLTYAGTSASVSAVPTNTSTKAPAASPRAR